MTAAATATPAPPVRVADPLDPYNSKKGWTHPIARALMKRPDTLEAGRKMSRCAEVLGLRLKYLEDGNLQAALQAAYTCQQRLCPFCEWRRTRAWRARLLRGLEGFQAAYPTHKGLLLTLTVKNGPLGELREQLDLIHKGWDRMNRGRWFPTPFWFRRTEITLPASPFENGAPRFVHPHLHVLLMVPASYFGRNYIKQTEWQQQWMMAARLDYAPVVDVRRTYVSDKVDKGKPAEIAAIWEAAKYLAKASEIQSIGAQVDVLHDQLRHVRLYAASHGLRQFIRTDEIDSVEMTDEDQCSGALSQEESFVRAFWSSSAGRYQFET